MKAGRKVSIILIIVVVLAVTIYLARSGRIPAGSVLLIDLSGPVEEQKPTGFLAALFGNDILVLHNVLDAIDAAKTDPRVTGVVMKIYNPEARWGKLQEIRQHLVDFRASGKPSLCLLGGDFNPNRDYFVATGCQQIWLVPTAPLGVTGLMTQSTFYRGVFDKLKIVPEFYHIAEYKTAANQYMEKKYTPAHKEMAESLMQSTYGQYLDGIAQGRKVDRAKVEALVAAGPLTAHEALDGKLVDKLGYFDEVQKFFRQRSGGWRPVGLDRYVKQLRNEGEYKIAVVTATGEIIVGDSQWTPSTGFIMGSDSVSSDLRQARLDDSIKAIVFRVDSPGGSAVASDIIGREVELAAKSKPVVVSMSDVAGSGGYWIAMSGTKIVADGDTLTGSIGVVLGKLNISGLYQMVGLSTDQVQTSDNATIFSDQQNFTPAQSQKVQAMMRSLYDDFCKGVATGRHMKVERVNEIGRGRVWTGAQGKENGLVDELGGLTRAIALARGLSGIPAGAKVQLIYFPREKSFLENLLSPEEKASGAEILTHLHTLAARLSATMELRMPFDVDIR
ncbi:MAG TPA: signal peptide peptidase SppA [Candidatus Acidoferrales bacterium]|nr:signal peptide peptidase SppA [Candidatus Acidoferrales bacterium]